MTPDSVLLKPIRVLVVDDSAITRLAFERIVRSMVGFEMAGTAADGQEAIGRLLTTQPDVVFLDLEMPVLDGFAFLRWTLRHRPVPVIVVSSQSDASSVFKAMDLGALDFVIKPQAGSLDETLSRMARDLSARIAMLATAEMGKIKRRVDLLAERYRIREQAAYSKGIQAVAIGASTGGPSALHFILSTLPSDFPAPLIVSQHMPPGFTGPFVRRLSRSCGIQVREVTGGEPLRPGTAFVVKGDSHVTLNRVNGEVWIQPKQAEERDMYVPSINRMMNETAREFGKQTLGVLLTGMGDDGGNGMLEIVRTGGYTIAESEDTAVIYGMPESAVALGAARKVLPLDLIPGEMVRACRGYS